MRILHNFDEDSAGLEAGRKGRRREDKEVNGCWMKKNKKKKNDAWRVAWKGLKIALHTPRSAPRWLKKTNRRKREKKCSRDNRGERVRLNARGFEEFSPRC